MFWLAVFFFLLVPQNDVLSLGGSVFDPDSKPAGNVRVRLDQPTEQKQWEATTLADGTFRFDRLSYGTYRLTIHEDGYFDVSSEVRLESSKIVEFTLAAAEKLEQEIDVVARPEPINPDAVSPQTTVNDEVIQNLPYTGRQNFLNALSLMPGVTRDSTGQIHIHGSSSDQIRYQLDGMNLTDASSGGLASNIPLDAIESVDMDLAGYSAEYGKGSGGVVRVHSQFIGDKYKFNMTDFVPGVDIREKSVAEFSPRLLFSGPVVRNKLWFMYSGSLRYVHNWIESLPKPDNQQRQTMSDQLLKFQWNLRESHVVTIDLIHNTEFLGNDGLSVVRPRETTTNSIRRGTSLGISERRVVGGKLIETLLQWTHRQDSNLAKGTELLEVRPELWTGNYFTDRRGHLQRWHAAQSMAWQTETGSITHRFKAGGEFDYVNSDVNLDRRRFELFNEAGALRSSVNFVGPNTADLINQEYGAFFQDRILLHPKLQVETGVRYDRERIVGRNNLAPRLGFSFLPRGTTRSKISGGVGLFYDNITFLNIQLTHLQRRYTTLYTDDGVPVSAAAPTDVRVSPDLRNAHGVHWNLAWENEWAPRWVSRIEYIEKNGRDQTRLAALPTPAGFDVVYNNSGRSDYRAVEFTVDRPIRTDLRILASYTYSNAKARPSVSLDFPDPAVEAIPEVPVEWNTPHRFVTWGYFPLPSHLNASFSVEARSGFPYTAIDDLNHIVGGYNAKNMPTFFTTNASLEKQIPIPFANGKRVALRVGVTNLFNHFNPRFVDANVNSPNYGLFTDSSRRHFVARIRILKK
jgi:outer membrane receptor protein involved in Fe transport